MINHNISVDSVNDQNIRNMVGTVKYRSKIQCLQNSRQYKIQAVEAISGQTASLGYAFEAPPYDVVPTGSILSLPDADGSPLSTFGIDVVDEDFQVDTDGSNTNFFNNF